MADNNAPGKSNEDNVMTDASPAVPLGVSMIPQSMAQLDALRQAAIDEWTVLSYESNPNLYKWQDKLWVFYTDASINYSAPGPPCGTSVVWCAPEDGTWVGRAATKQLEWRTDVAEMAAVKMCLTLIDQMITSDSSWVPEEVLIWTDSQNAVNRINYLHRLAVGMSVPPPGVMATAVPSWKPAGSNVIFLDYGEPEPEEMRAPEPSAEASVANGELQQPITYTQPLPPSRTGHRDILGDSHVVAHMSALLRRGIRVQVKWCKGHSGVLGNIVADDAARFARKKDEERKKDTPFRVFRYFASHVHRSQAVGQSESYQIASSTADEIPYDDWVESRGSFA